MPDVIVLHKSGKWYVKHHHYGTWSPQTRINGKVVTLCPDSTWCWIAEEPKALERLVPKCTNTIGYKLKGADNPLQLQERVDRYFFRYLNDGGMNNEGLRDYYEEIVETTEEYYESVACNFLVIHLDAEPVTFEFPVKVKYPDVFAEYKEVHHLYPCEITGENLYVYLHGKVKAIVASSKNLRMNDHFSLKSMDVSKRILLAAPKTVQKDVSGVFARKPKYRDVVETEKWEKVLDLYGSTYQYGERVNGIEAANYAELKEKVDRYVNAQLAKLDDTLYQHCPHCSGEGIVQYKQESRNHVTA